VRWLIQPDSPLCLANLPQLDIDDCVGVAGPIGDFRGQLLATEAHGIDSWVMKRQLEYSTGRHFAHLAMQTLGEKPTAVERRADRSPIWPVHFLGSIAHCEDMGIAIVARAHACRGIGVDIERRGRIGADLFATLFTEHERCAISSGTSATELFCAKEALYKAVHPIVQTFINFTDVSFVHEAAASGEAIYVGNEQPVDKFISSALFSKQLTLAHACVVAWLPHAIQGGRRNTRFPMQHR